MFAWVWFSRSAIRFIVRASLQTNMPKRKIVIYGAGYAGQQIAAMLNRSDEHFPLFFIDDDESLTGQIIGGLKVYNAEQALKHLDQEKVDEILIALPSKPGDKG
jgi:Predicted nucleoside-diphosphate sugar epimerases